MNNMNDLSKNELITICKDKGIKRYSSKKKTELIELISQKNPDKSHKQTE